MLAVARDNHNRIRVLPPAALRLRWDLSTSWHHSDITAPEWDHIKPPKLPICKSMANVIHDTNEKLSAAKPSLDNSVGDLAATPAQQPTFNILPYPAVMPLKPASSCLAAHYYTLEIQWPCGYAEAKWKYGRIEKQSTKCIQSYSGTCDAWSRDAEQLRTGKGMFCVCVFFIKVFFFQRWHEFRRQRSLKCSRPSSTGSPECSMDFVLSEVLVLTMV